MERRDLVLRWIERSIRSADPEERTAEAIDPNSPRTVVAIGKAAAAMCRGASRALGEISGVCVTTAPDDVPDGIDLLIGDHPIPGEGSFEAGRRVLETARASRDGLTALISGGGSALCERPLPGIDRTLIQIANARLLDGGASIEETNLVRRHLSAIKCGGVARVAAGLVDTYIVSDVGGAGPEVVASGPTIPVPRSPDEARRVMNRYGIPLDHDTWAVINAPDGEPAKRGRVTVLSDGRMAAQAIADAARQDGVGGRLIDGWIGGDVEEALESFLGAAGSGITVGAGEPNVRVVGDGVGGRNSHAALLAAVQIAGTESLFAAFATDGVDGRSDGAGAVVDGTTIDRGGDPTLALSQSDSATYLEEAGDLVRIGPTRTNVSDLWLFWRP
jgi:hydroxypyruvate reductase